MMDDENFMRQALALAEQGRVTAPPNPWVGCVIVKKGTIIGKGFHQKPGLSHAEPLALKQAGEQTKDSTVYVTLEPCSHHGRTPPCVETLLQYQPKRVVVAIEDPDLNVAGKGISLLRDAGIQVDIGICEKEVKKSLTPYLHHRKTGKAYCVMKAASSIDGRIAAVDASSQWITSEKAREDAHRLRAESQAILVGSQTALTDLPKLTVRNQTVNPIAPPLRVILDRQGKVPATGPLFDCSLAPTLVCTSSLTKKQRIQEWEQTGAGVLILPEEKPLQFVLQELGKKEVLQVLVEGGAAIYSALLKENLIDQLHLYIGNKILGSEGLPLFSDLTIPNLKNSPKLHLESVSQFEESARLDFTFKKEEKHDS